MESDGTLARIVERAEGWKKQADAYCYGRRPRRDFEQFGRLLSETFSVFTEMGYSGDGAAESCLTDFVWMLKLLPDCDHFAIVTGDLGEVFCWTFRRVEPWVEMAENSRCG